MATYLSDSRRSRLALPLTARISAGLWAGAAAFQVALAAGAPRGRLAFGGRHTGTLPPEFRLTSIGSAALLTAFAVALGTGWAPRRRTALRGLLGFCAVSAVVNAISPSLPEKLIWTPFALTHIALLGTLLRRMPAELSLPTKII